MKRRNVQHCQWEMVLLSLHRIIESTPLLLSFVKCTLWVSSKKRVQHFSRCLSKYWHIQQLCTEVKEEAFRSGVKQLPNPFANPRHHLLQSMATGNQEAVPALHLECWSESACCPSPGLKVIIPELLYNTVLLHPVQYPAQPLNCISTNAHYSLFLMALARGKLMLGGLSGLPPPVPHQTDWCKGSQSPSGIGWEKNITQAAHRGSL